MFRKSLSFAAGAAALALLSAFPPAADARDIVFVGDSITQGGAYLAGPVASWRYALFKHFVDAGEEFFPMGTTVGARGNTDVSALCPPYRGVAFTNVSEAAASARAYQYAGHVADGKFRADPGSAFPPENRGPVTIKLGQKNPFTGTDEFFDGTARKKYVGETYRSRYGARRPDTLCVLIGINDLYDAREGNAAIAEHVHGIVKAFQKHNLKIRVHVFELLPTGRDNGTGTTGKNNYIPYNEYLRGVVRKWSTASSKVTLDRISDGFYAESGAMIDTARGAHPNRQGELIVAGNAARALGLPQRSAGLERRGNAELASAAENLASGKFSRKGAGVSASGDRAVFASGEGESTLAWAWNKKGKAREFTLAFSAKLDATARADNALCVVVGNGAEAGVLAVREEGVFWNDALLYGADALGDKAHNSFSTTKTAAALRVAWLDGNARAGVPGGFYVWLGDVLVGEALSGDARFAAHRDKFIFGDLGASQTARATLSDVRFRAGTPFAPPSEKK
ncbi:MAG: hypothetical protein ACI4QA_05290 [Candidatus Spyradosoma sp.]